MLTSLLGCASERILEYRDTLQFQVSENSREDQDVVRISGLCGHSAMSVKKINIVHVDGDVEVEVVVGLSRGNESGSFSQDVTLTSNVARIVFGKERYEIWRRKK